MNTSRNSMDPSQLSMHIDDLPCSVQSGLDPVLLIRMMVDQRDQTVEEYFKLFEEFCGESRVLSYLWLCLTEGEPSVEIVVRDNDELQDIISTVIVDTMFEGDEDYSDRASDCAFCILGSIEEYFHGKG